VRRASRAGRDSNPPRYVRPTETIATSSASRPPA
jgi:hypothetical protein